MELICTFFGHRNCGDGMVTELRKPLIDLIENMNVNCFYVGNQGNFDRLVQYELKQLKKYYPIECYIVLAYMPTKNQQSEGLECFVPEGIETVPPRFAIEYRNRWMLERADYVVGYVYRPFGGAAKFLKMAIRKNKTVMNLGS